MDRVQHILALYGGDGEGVAQRFMGDAELYWSCLAEFKEDGDFDNLETALREEDYTRAFECAHSLKGVSGNLGLTPFYQAISVLVDTLRENNLGSIETSLAAVREARKSLPECDTLDSIERS